MMWCLESNSRLFLDKREVQHTRSQQIEYFLKKGTIQLPYEIPISRNHKSTYLLRMESQFKQINELVSRWRQITNLHVNI